MLRNSGQTWIGSLSTDYNGRRANVKRKIRWTGKLILVPYASALKEFSTGRKLAPNVLRKNLSYNIYKSNVSVTVVLGTWEDAKSKLKGYYNSKALLAAEIIKTRPTYVHTFKGEKIKGIPQEQGLRKSFISIPKYFENTGYV